MRQPHYKSFLILRNSACLYTSSSDLAEIIMIFIMPFIISVLYTTRNPESLNLIFKSPVRLELDLLHVILLLHPPHAPNLLQ